MTAMNRHRARGREVLGILKEHGPLSFGVMRRMTQPVISTNGLEKAIAVLRRKGFVESRRNSDGRTFYQITQSADERREIARILDCRMESLFQPLLPKSEWLHHQICEYWIYLLKRIFPEIKIVRDSEFTNSDEAKRVLLASDEEQELFPDFMLVFPTIKPADPTYIAVEIERTRKSEKRLVSKLGKYANQSFIDGLIYVCETDRLCEAIRLLYCEKIVAKAHRIKHYGENFFLFSDAIEPAEFPFSRLFNARRKPVSIVDWCNYLCSTKRTLRRDVSFN